MKGDFTRDSFDPLKSFSRVLMQQGRIELDSDWNEQASLTLAYVRTLARDLLGEGAGPERDCGFKIAALGDLERIGDAGRFTSIEKALLEANRSALEDGDLLLLPGRYYVGGIPVELRQAMLYRAQPGYPFNEASPTGLPAGPGEGSIAYLDVWEDFVSAVEDEALRDPALGGVDTCGRGVVRWQVRILQGGIQEFEALSSSSPGRLSASGAYSGLENHLYRVEIHRGSDSDGSGATFKWSRDNGSVAWRIEEIVGKWVRLARSARDEPSPLAPGNWVELSCDCLRGHDPEGVLGRVAEVSPEDGSLIVEWAGSAPVPTLPIEALRPVLRRWDHAGLVEVGVRLPSSRE